MSSAPTVSLLVDGLLVDPLLTEQETATALRLKCHATLRRWRQHGIGPRFVKLGAGGPGATIRYRQSDIVAWIDANTSPEPASK